MENLPLPSLQAWDSKTLFPSLRSSSFCFRVARFARISSDSEAMIRSFSVSILDTNSGLRSDGRLDIRHCSIARTVTLLINTGILFYTEFSRRSAEAQ